ncbi:GcrA family cell cycle regulator [Microvirga zambiensis]|uniref:GcrA family cell cycle regulator n=1 Tax=Microvirga zambiensis TaxID=1402137 RepID=UPI003CCCFE76
MPGIQIPVPSPRDRTTLLKLRARQCRFLVSDDGAEALLCGAETRQGSSWCPWHQQLVYVRALSATIGKQNAPVDAISSSPRRKVNHRSAGSGRPLATVSLLPTQLEKQIELLI